MKWHNEEKIKQILEENPLPPPPYLREGLIKKAAEQQHKNKRFPWLRIAAIFLLLLGIGLLFKKIQPHKKSDIQETLVLQEKTDTLPVFTPPEKVLFEKKPLQKSVGKSYAVSRKKSEIKIDTLSVKKPQPEKDFEIFTEDSSPLDDSTKQELSKDSLRIPPKNLQDSPVEKSRNYVSRQAPKKVPLWKFLLKKISKKEKSPIKIIEKPRQTEYVFNFGVFEIKHKKYASTR